MRQYRVARVSSIALALALILEPSVARAWEAYPQGAESCTEEERATGLLLDGAGNVIVSGLLDDPLTLGCGLIATTVKLDLADGSEIWRQTGVGAVGSDAMVLFGGAAVVGGIRLDPATGAILSGTFPGVGGIPDGADFITGTSYPTFAVRKYDGTTFAPIWTSPAMGSAPQSETLILAAGPAGSVIAAGVTYLSSPAWVVARISTADGSVIWQQEFPNLSYTESTAPAKLAVAADGTVFVGGRLGAADNQADLTILRLNAATGAVEWTSRSRGAVTGFQANGLSDLLLTNDGGLIAGGVLVGEPLPTCNDAVALIMRLDPADGSMDWDYRLSNGCAGGVGIADIGLDGSGNILAVATRRIVYSEDLVARYLEAIKLDSAGVEVWRRDFASAIDGRGTSLEVVGDTPVVAGMAEGVNRDFFVARLSAGGGDYPCGNSVVDPGETCDDGNNASCDGCRSDCQVEAGPICGDGVLGTSCGEECDDGNVVDGDGCSSACLDQALPESSQAIVVADVPFSSDSEADGATVGDPIETSVTSPTGGEVTIDETAATTDAPLGFAVLSQVVHIEAPEATAADPLRFAFLLDSSRVPAGETKDTIAIFRNDLSIAGCTGASGVADPDPCVESRSLEGDDVEIVVLSSHASLWYLGVSRQVGVPIAATKIAIKERDGDPTKRSLILLAKDEAIRAADLTCAAPGGGGATLQIEAMNGGPSAAIVLPCENWGPMLKKGLLVGSRYRDPDQSEGPCKSAILKAGTSLGLLKVVCNGARPMSPLTYDLSPAGQGGARFEIGFGSSRFCGLMVRRPTLISGTPGDDASSFLAVKKTAVSAAPAECPD